MFSIEITKLYNSIALTNRFFRYLIPVLVLLLSFSPLFAQDFDMDWYRKALVVDPHSDAILSHIRGRNLEKRSDKGHVDFIRLAEGGVDVQFFALWPSPKYKPDGMFKHTVMLLDSLQAVVSRNPDKIRLCRTPEEIEKRLLEVRKIFPQIYADIYKNGDAIQWVPGAGEKENHTEWVNLLKKIHNAGKNLILYPRNSDELKLFHKEFGPEGIAYQINFKNLKELEEVEEWLKRSI